MRQTNLSTWFFFFFVSKREWLTANTMVNLRVELELSL